MKKLSIGIVAVVLAVGMSAFTNSGKIESSGSKTTDYWFPTDASGNPQPSSALNTTDVYGCSGGTISCAKAYTQYTFDGTNYNAVVSSYANLQDFKR